MQPEILSSPPSPGANLLLEAGLKGAQGSGDFSFTPPHAYQMKGSGLHRSS